MNIVVLQGSPNRRGSTYLLADSFRQGAESAGHAVEIIDVAHADIHPCTGCVHCGYEGPCVQKDGAEEIRRKILGADMLVFATPLYYYGMSAQLKTLHRPLLCLQCKSYAQAYEKRPARRGVEQRRLDF